MKLKYYYIAGYIDGDGCFSISKTNDTGKLRGFLVVSSTNEIVLQSIKDDFGGQIRKMKIYNIKYKPQFQWYKTGKKAFEFCEQITEFLIERKIEAIYFGDFFKVKSTQAKEIIMDNLKEYRFLNKQITTEVFEDIKKTIYKNNFTEENAAYLAGFIDAECSLGISKYRRKGSPNYIYKIILSCNNTSPNIFYWFMEKIGGSLTYVSRKEKNPNHRDQINWNISGIKAYEILQKVYPFLRAKKEVCKTLMEFQQLTLKNGGDRQSEDFKSSYANIISQKEKIVDIVHKLNSKGSNNV